MLDVSVSCDEKNLYQEYTLNSSRYVCTEEDGWLRLSYPSSVLGYCHEKVWGTIAKTSDTTDSYMCDSLGWRKATVQDVHGKCTTDVAYKVVEFDSVKYMCLPSRSWRKETTVDSALGFCTKALDDSAKIYNDNFYRCSRGEWIRVDNYDYLGTCNNMTVWDSVHVGSLVYVCNEWPSWQLQEYAGEYGLCTMDNLGAVVNGSFGVRICKKGYHSNMAWEPANAIEAEVGYCADDTTFAVVTDSLCYYCNSGTWKTGTCQLSDYIGDCSSRAAGVIDTVYKGVEYVCDTSASLLGWHKMTAIDSLYGYCRTAIIGKTYDYTDSTSLVCNKVSSEKKWVEVAKDTTSASAED